MYPRTCPNLLLLRTSGNKTLKQRNKMFPVIKDKIKPFQTMTSFLHLRMKLTPRKKTTTREKEISLI